MTDFKYRLTRTSVECLFNDHRLYMCQGLFIHRVGDAGCVVGGAELVESCWALGGGADVRGVRERPLRLWPVNRGGAAAAAAVSSAVLFRVVLLNAVGAALLYNQTRNGGRPGPSGVL